MKAKIKPGADTTDPTLQWIPKKRISSYIIESGADLKDADLKDADLTDADLQYADLKNANLKGALHSDQKEIRH